MYLSSIIGYLTWPAIIIFSYYMIRWALRKFEARVAQDELGQK